MVYNTFNSACVALGLLEDNRECIKCFNEAIIIARGGCLQHLLAMALAYGGISHLVAIWEQFWDDFYNDISLQRLERLNCPTTLENQQYGYGLYMIQQQLLSMNKRLTDFYLPRIIHPWVDYEQFPRIAYIRNINHND